MSDRGKLLILIRISHHYHSSSLCFDLSWLISNLKGARSHQALNFLILAFNYFAHRCSYAKFFPKNDPKLHTAIFEPSTRIITRLVDRKTSRSKESLGLEIRGSRNSGDEFFRQSTREYQG